MDNERKMTEAAKKTWHKPRLMIYGDPLELTESAGRKMAEDGGGSSYVKLKTA